MNALMETARELPSESDRSEAASEMRGQIRIVADDVKKLGEVAKRTASAKLHEVRDKAGRAVETVRDKKDEIGNRATRAVRARPMTAVLVSAGVGAALGSLWRVWRH